LSSIISLVVEYGLHASFDLGNYYPTVQHVGNEMENKTSPRGERFSPLKLS
jgi:hypothetical protein